MKLRNKKTGEVVNIDFLYPDTAEDFHPEYSLKDFIAEWEDYEEPVYYYFIQDDGRIGCDAVEPYNHKPKVEEHKSIGNYFESREEAERAIEKLKAWKRLRDRGFRFERYMYNDILEGTIGVEAQFDNDGQVDKDLDLLFGGEK